MSQPEQGRRARQKEQSHQRIVEAAARQFREEGLSGAGLHRIMEAAGLTHGGFYSHFESKADLVSEALVEAVGAQTQQWLAGLDDTPEKERLAHLVARYLSRRHRDAPGVGCPLPAISAEVARAPESVRRVYDALIREVLAHMESSLAGEEDETLHTRAVAALALCVGGLMLARAVDDPALSDDILQSCRKFAADTDAGEKEQT